MIKKMDVIASFEIVSFPELAVNEVPAKVDTGADSSALHASEINLDANGDLSFKLFAPGSRFYSGQVLTVKAYKRALVKNSSGAKEPRYKVNLLVKIGGRRVRGWFTLADRSGMTYPILIGRRTLKNKFLVDVGLGESSAKSGDKTSKVLVLGAPAHRAQPSFDGVASAARHDVEFSSRSLSQLAFWLAPGQTTVTETTGGQDIADFSLVYFKTHRRYYEFAIAAAEYLQFNHVRFFDQELAGHVGYDKLSEAMRLLAQGLAVPKAVCASSSFLKHNLPKIGKFVGWPIVIKEINADRGRQNYLVGSTSELKKIFESSLAKDIFMLQSYIENDGYLRIYVFGSEIALAVRRSAVENEDPQKKHLNNPAGSSNASLLPTDKLPAAAAELALAAARGLDRQVAGVDLIFDKLSKQWLVLEVNSAPQIRSGTFTEEKLKAFAKFIDNQIDK